MSNIHNLCPHVLPLKDLLTAAREIEDFIKGSTGNVGKSNEELMAEFLGGKGSMAAIATNDAATTAADPESVGELDMPDILPIDIAGTSVAAEPVLK